MSFQFKKTKNTKKLPLSIILLCLYQFDNQIVHTSTKLINPWQQCWVLFRSLDFWLLIPCQSWCCFEASLIEGSPFNCFIKVFTKEFDQKTIFSKWILTTQSQFFAHVLCFFLLMPHKTFCQKQPQPNRTWKQF